MRTPSTPTMRRAPIVVTVGVLLCVIAAACSGGGGKASGPDGTAPGIDLGSGTARATGSSGEWIEVSYDPQRPRSITVDVSPFEGADEVQLSTDATFGAAPWQAVTAQVHLPTPDVGYVQVFARFRADDGARVSEPIVAGLTVDPTRTAATDAAADKPHQVAEAGLAAADILMVRVETGRILWTPGTEPDVVVGYPVAEKKLDDASGYVVSSSDDPAFAAGEAPVSVSRVTRAVGTANTAQEEHTQIAIHDVYLRLSSTVKSGSTYQVSFPEGVVAPAEFTFDPSSSRSYAVHVNQVGFKPNDSLKVGYVSAWDGTDITPSGPLPFSVIDSDSGQVVLEAASTERVVGNGGDFGRGDLTGTRVHELDFSAVTEPGAYRVCVDAIGCSSDFSISDEATWRRVAVSVARALYHQRSGLELTEPYTSVARPRGFHPDDGVEVRQSKLTEPEMADGSFKALVAAATDVIVPDAWGGHFDAGDWDRRIAHLAYLRTALDLVDQYPDTWADLDLNIPESGDAIPDVIDEGLWDLDFYRRLQTADGGIRGGIESEEHPAAGQTSWTQTQRVFAFAPDARSSYIYAAVAADTARVLADYDSDRADGYSDSALAAMKWAEANPITVGEAADSTRDARAMAAAALFRLTGDDEWQDVFVAASPFASGSVELLGCTPLGLCDAAWIYANTDQPGIRSDVKQNVIDSFQRNAKRLADTQDANRYGWSLEHPDVPLIWGLGPSIPKTIGLLRAYELGGDARFCRAALRNATFSLGANPLDTVFLTGVGSKNVRYPLVVDSYEGGIPVWPGTPVFGLHQLNALNDEKWVAQWRLRPVGANPDPESVPFLQSYWDVSSVPMMNEYTVHQSHAVALYAYGSLAGLDC